MQELPLDTLERYGFTAIEAASLLSHRRQAEVLGATWPQPFAAIEGCSTTYTPCLSFADIRDLKRARRLAPLWMRYTSLGDDARALAERYRAEIFAGAFADSAIQWISPEIGHGLFAQSPIAEGAYVGNYAGRLRKARRLEGDWNAYCFQYPTCFYRLGVYLVDALHFGNQARFINHSDQPNLSFAYALDRGLLHLLLFAKRDIAAEEQLTVDYGGDFWKSRRKEALD